MKKTKKSTIVFSVIAAVVLVGIITAFSVFSGLIFTMASIESKGSGVYESVNHINYDLDELLADGGVADEEALVQYAISVIAKGIPVEAEYEIPDLACSSFMVKNTENQYLMGRNLDNFNTDIMVLHNAPKNGYKSVSVVNLAFLGYTDGLTPDKVPDRLNALAGVFFPLDGMNEKGVSVSVLQVMAEPTKQKTDKPDVTTTLAIRLILDKAGSVQEAVDLLSGWDMYASANGCYVFHIADSTGKSAVVSYDGDKMNVTYAENDYQYTTNFLLYDVDYDYLKVGVKRYDILKEKIESSKGVLSEKQAMELLSDVSMTEDVPDESGAYIPTQWSAVYNLNEKTVTICTDRNYEKSYTFSVEK